MNRSLNIRSMLCSLALISLCLTGCEEPDRVSGPHDRIKVVASIFPLSDFVRNVGGERVEVLTLLPPAASPHVYSPAPRDLARLQDARLFVKIGLGFEFWAGNLAHAGAGPGLAEVDTSQGMEVIEETETGHGRPAGNPHIWLDPVLAMEQVKRIKEALVKIDPAHQAEYEKNTETYLNQLKVLNLEIRNRVKSFRVNAFISFHPSWTYFAKRYGLVEAGVIETSPGREPAPGELMKIVQGVKASGVKVIFAEPQLNPKTADVVASEVGGRVFLLDPIGSPEHEDRSTYLKLMRYNLAIMQQAFGGP